MWYSTNDSKYYNHSYFSVITTELSLRKWQTTAINIQTLVNNKAVIQ